MRFFSLPHVFFMLFLPVFGIAQQKFSATDKVFFDLQQETYQRWLDQTGLGRVLQTNWIQLSKKDTEVELLLSFKTFDIDTAGNQWNLLKKGLKEAGGGELSDVLFKKFIHFMEIPPEQGNVQIYLNKETGNFSECLRIYLWEENGFTQMEEVLNSCKSSFFYIPLPSVNVHKVVRGKSTTITKKRTTQEVFNLVSAYAHNRFDRKGIHGRQPKVEDEKIIGNRFIFNVEDLGKEVLTDQDRSFWCKIVESLGGKCNDITRERLEFQFDYDPENAILHCEISGKFGSGVYRPRLSGWMSMEPDFEKYLERYTARFGNELQLYLKKR